MPSFHLSQIRSYYFHPLIDESLTTKNGTTDICYMDVTCANSHMEDDIEINDCAPRPPTSTVSSISF